MKRKEIVLSIILGVAGFYLAPAIAEVIRSFLASPR
jgi:hypothetical protein